MIYSEMLSVQMAIDATDTEDELKAAMERIKRDIDARQDTEWSWHPEQAQRVRGWCRKHRELIRNHQGVIEQACYGWLADRVDRRAMADVE
uniref:Uncharacterized protein n=1 Tax=viral metagenome TaxID=1070528 RepID=A0A6M3LFY0_9ZZZZ